MYIYQRKGWPHFHWDVAAVASALASVRYEQGQLWGRMTSLGFPLSQEAVFQALTQEVIKTSEIEGEKLDLMQVRSSLARQLGIHIAGMKASSKQVEGVVAMLLDATTHYHAKLTQTRLFEWH